MSEEEVLERLMLMEQWKDSGDICTREELQAIGILLDLYNKEKEKNKIIANDIENYKAQAYMLGRADETEAMKGVIERHYISRDKIREKLKEIEENELLQKIDFNYCKFATERLQELLEK